MNKNVLTSASPGFRSVPSESFDYNMKKTLKWVPNESCEYNLKVPWFKGQIDKSLLRVSLINMSFDKE